MIHALIFGGLWIFVALTESASTPMLVRIGASGSMALSYLLTWYVPIWFKHRHIRSQNRLLDRCRALLLIGSKAHSEGDVGAATDALNRIRRMEQLWRFGNAMTFRVALAVWAIGWSIVICVLLRFAGLAMAHHGWTGRVMAFEKVPAELWLALAISLFALLHALASYFESWVNPWALENCGDRLWQVMYGPRAVEIGAAPPSGVPDLDGLSPHQIFGLSPGYTRSELDRARRRLVRELHPDRWQHVSVRDRQLREEALKRVNAAYDLLRASAP